MFTMSYQSVCQHNSTKQIKIDNIIFSMDFNFFKFSFFLSYLTKYAINITFYNLFNQFDGSNVFSGHIR